MKRREFFSHVGIGGSLLAAGMRASADPFPDPPPQAASAGNGSPKLGCVSWNFHSLAAGANPEKAIDIIGSLGFDGVELIANSKRDVDDYWTDATIDRVRKQVERNHLVVNQFPMFQPVVEGLTSRNPAEREKNLDYFERACRIGKKLGAPMVNIVAPWARELSTPATDYLPRYFLDNPKPGEKFHINIASGFDFEQLWRSFTGTMQACLERAKAHGMRFSIENHTYTMMPVSDSFLRLWDNIRDPQLGCNLDCGWAMNQRDYPPVAIYKLNRHLMNLHVRDIDATMREYVPIGTGVMDFKAIADAAKAVGFTGFLSLEQDGSGEHMQETCRRYIATMKQAFA